MAENRPYRPFAANIHVMQRTFLVHAGICGIRVLQNFVAENNFFARSINRGQPSPRRKSRISVAQKLVTYRR